MLTTLALAFVAGFFAGNGLPYYLSGSTGESRHPAPFRDSARVSVLVGCAAFVTAAVAWNYAHVNRHPLPGHLAAIAGIMLVGLIHTRTWRDPNPWGKRSRLTDRTG